MRPPGRVGGIGGSGLEHAPQRQAVEPEPNLDELSANRWFRALVNHSIDAIVVRKKPKASVTAGPYLYMDAVLVDGANVAQFNK